MDLSKLSDAELQAMLGEGAAPSPGAPAADPFAGKSDAELQAMLGEEAPAAPERSAFGTYAHMMGLGARTAYSGGLQGLSSAATLGADAAINAAYGAKKLASKTGLVEAPDPENYYHGRGYLPTTEAVGEKIEKGLDAVGLPKAEGATERVVSAAGSGVASALSGAGLGKAVATGGSALAQRVGGFMAAQPEIQAASGAASGAAAQGVTEAGGSSTDATVAGFLAGGATGLAGAKVRRAPTPPVPTTEDLRNAKSAAYAAKDAAGITVDPAQAQRFAATVRRDLPGEGVFPEHDAPARTILAGMDRLGQPNAAGVRQPVTLAEIEKVRQNAGLLQKSPEPATRRTGSILTGQLDDFVDAIPGAGPLSDNARAANRRYAKASALDLALDKAELKNAASYSGNNIENTQRQNLRQIIQDPNSRAFRQFDAPERAAMRDIVEGSSTQNALRYVGKFAPKGPVSFATSLLSAKSGFGALPVAGLVAKTAGDALQGRKVARLNALVKGGPGAGVRPPAGYRANAARGAAQGFLAGPGAAARYR
jgi:hypothetical protein